MKKARWNLSLVMLMICPFVVFYYISSNQNAVNSNICTVQVQIQRDFIFASAHTADRQCPRQEPRNSIDLNLSDKGNGSSFTFWQRLSYDYEILAAVVFVHRTRGTSPAYTADTAGATSRRPPKYIKKRFPGLKRERWRRMTIAFSKNALLRDIFYRFDRESSMCTFMEMISCMLNATFVGSVKYTIFVTRFSFALLTFWIRYAIILTRYHTSMFRLKIIRQFISMRFRCSLMRLQLMLQLRALCFCICYPLAIHASPEKIVICYLEMISNVLAPRMWRFAESIADSLRLVLFFARSYSLSFAIEIMFGWRLESKRNRIRSKKPSRSPSWQWKFLLLILLSYPQLVDAPENEPSACYYCSIILLAAVKNIMKALGALFFIISAACYLYRRAPSLKDAEAHIKRLRVDCGPQKPPTPSPITKFRPKSSHGMSRRFLVVLIIISRPALVTAPNNAAYGSSPPIPIAAAVIGTGIAAAASLAVTVNGYHVRRTYKWTEKEAGLKRRCILCEVDYETPPLHETKQQQAARRKRLIGDCEAKEKEQRRIETEEELEKCCLENGVAYTPPAPNESAFEQKARRQRLRLNCQDSVKKAERLSKKAERAKKKRSTETAEARAERLTKVAERAKKKRSTETAEARADRQRGDVLRKRKGREEDKPGKKAQQQQKDRERHKIQREEKRKKEDEAFREDDVFIDGEVPCIEVSTDRAKMARELLVLRTAVGDNRHRATGCTVCDEFIIGTEETCYITKEQLHEHKERLGAEAYEEYYGGQPIDEELKKQYEIRGMEGMLLSRRFGKDDANHFMVCSRCKDSLTKDNIGKSPPKYSIANGFLIGSIPRVIKFTNKDGEEEKFTTVSEVFDEDGNLIPNRTESKVTSIMAAAISPTRPYAYIFSYRGGRHQSLVGNFQFFDTDQTKIAGALTCLHESGMTSNIYVVLNGRMTASQKDIIRKKAELDTHLYFSLLRWFKQHHPGFRDVVIDENSELKIELIEDPSSDANTDESGDQEVENKEEGATFHFSSGGEPTTDTSVFKTNKELVMALLKNHSAPTLTIHGGNYASHLDVMHLENVFPTIFPFGSGGPTLDRRNRISDEEIIRHYLRLALPQFLESEFVLVANFLLGRILSYRSAVMKCRPLINEHGIAVGDVIGTMTIEEIKAAIEEENSNENTTASKFLKAVSASCRHLGVTEEAAKQARRKCFALQDFFGMHSLFVTITIDDECSFRVRLYPYADANGEGTPLPPIDLSDAECIADLALRRRIRRKYPGACSLEFQSAMEIALECLFGWDTGRQTGRRGLFGIMEAFCRADEEQGRGSLHSHWLVWIKNFGHLRRLMFAKDENTRDVARAEYIKYVNKVMCARQCGFEVEVNLRHTCRGEVKEGTPDKIFENCKGSVLRSARHEEGSRDVKGKVMCCKECKKQESPSDVTTEVLKNLQQEELSTSFHHPISRERLDIAAYRTVYDVPDENGKDADSTLRYILLNERFNQHIWEHTPSCYKKGCECRHLFPYLATDETRVYEGGKAPIKVQRHTLDGNVGEENRFVVDVQRPQGCQYMNVHNRTLSHIFTCNTNVAAGDSGQTFYQTLYNCKNTQPDDRESRDAVAKNVIRRLLRAQHDKERRELSGEESEEEVNTWVEGLSRVLSGINAATSRTVISAPMAHNIASHRGSRFHFSHEFAELLVGQLEDIAGGKEDVCYIVRKCKKDDEELKQWPDISANDYLFRSSSLDDFCFYHQSMYYTKCYKQDGHFTDSDDTATTKLRFGDDHPGNTFAYLTKVKHVKIPNTSIPDGKLCRIEELDINNDSPSDAVKKKREEYAKTALLMFCPFRKLDDLQHDKSYWRKFDLFRRHYFRTEGRLRYEDKKRNFELSPKDLNPDTVKKNQYLCSDVCVGSFWMKGFEILQNIEDRLSVEKCQGRARDVLSDEAKLPEKYTEGDVGNKEETSEERDDDLAKDIAFYCEQFDREQWVESEDHVRDYTHERLINSDITHDRVVKARLVSDESVIADSKHTADAGEDRKSNVNMRNHGPEANRNILRDRESYLTVIQLIKGSLLGGGGNYEDVYQTDGDEGDIAIVVRGPDSPQGQDVVDTTQQVPVPTLAGIARKVLRDESKRLDEKQYIMYEVIACSFLLGLLNQTDEEDDERLSLQSRLGGAIGQDIINDVEALKQMLRDRGGREQLVMFVTGFAGAGKSTAIKVAQKFCYEFCKAASIMWADNTFLFTAYTGSAAAAFGGLTTVKATYIGKKGNTPRLTDDEMKAFEGVRILIIDETSFLKDSELLKLDRTLKKIANDRRPFGGYSIIFAGDFQQNEPVRMKNNQKLWHPTSSMHFEHNINCAIILDGIHRFKDDETYGRILQRLCRGEMTQEDVDKINERYVGEGGVTLPKQLDGDTCYACETNKQRNAITAAIFREHLRQTHPRAGDANDPPKHTIIIKGLIESPTSSDVKIGSVLRRRIIELGDSDMRQEQKLISPHLCCYNGAYFMCNSNDNLKEHGTGNGTQARLVRVKLKDNPASYKCEVWDRRKVWTVCASDVEYAEFEHYPRKHDSPRRFKLTPKSSLLK